MAITNGSTITKADLDAMITASLALLQIDNAQTPGGLELNFTFPNLTATISTNNPERCKCVFIAPWDFYVESLCAETVDHTAASTFTASLYGDGNLLNFPRPASSSATTIPFIQVTVTGAAGNVKGLRLLRDNTKAHPKASAAQTQALTVITKGATVTLTVSTTSVAATTEAHVTVVLRQFWGRE